MASGATGTPSTTLLIPKINPSVDIPDGSGINSIVDFIDTALIGKSLLTTTGDIIYASAASTPARLAAGTSGYVLTSGGAGVAPAWAAAANGVSVATTVGGLPAGTAGAVALIRAGSTPFDFIMLTFDTTYNKWVSKAGIGQIEAVHAASGSAATWEAMSTIGGTIPYKVFTDAGLTLQTRIMGYVTAGAATVDLGVRLTPANSNAAKGTSGADAVLTTTAATTTMEDSGWAAPAAITAADMVVVEGRFRTGTNNVGSVDGVTVHYRWVS